jgi:hypothetical protein
MNGMSPLLFIPILTITVVLSLSVSNVYALTTVKNTTFSIDIPDNWTYEEGVMNSSVTLTPKEFGVLLLNNTEPFNETMKDGGAFSSFEQDRTFPIKNADFDLYVKYKIDRQDGMQVTSKQNGTIDNETAIKIYGDGVKSFSGIKIVEYMIWHDKKPYFIRYLANVKDFEKYLPQFEQILKTFKFVD